MIAINGFACGRDPRHGEGRLFTAWRPARLAVLFFFSWILVTVVPGAEQEGEMRTWTDSTGQSRVEAALVKVEDGKAHFRRKDGRPGSVPLERLSEADRHYIAKWQQRKPVAPAKEPAAPAKEPPKTDQRSSVDKLYDSIVVIRPDAPPEPPAVQLPGVLILVEKNTGYVVTYATDAFSPAGFAHTNGSFSAILGVGTDKPRTIAAKFQGADGLRKIAVWRIEAENLPAPIPLDGKGDLKDGARVTVLGCQIDTGPGRETLYKHVSTTAALLVPDTAATEYLTELGEHGSIKHIRVQANLGAGGVGPGIAVDHRSRVLGIVDRAAQGSLRTPPDNTVSRFLLPIAELVDLQRPRITRLALNARKWDADGIDFELVGSLQDFFDRAKETHLLMKRLASNEPRKAIDPSTMTALAWKPAAEVDANGKPKVAYGAGEFAATVHWRDVGRWDPVQKIQYAACLKMIEKSGKATIGPVLTPTTTWIDPYDDMMSCLRDLRAEPQPHPSGGFQVTRRHPEKRDPQEENDLRELLPLPTKEEWPKPEQRDEALAGASAASGKAQASTLASLKDEDGRFRMPQAVVWTPDGKYAFLALAGNVIRKVQFPEAREVKRLTLPVRMPPEFQELIGDSAPKYTVSLSAEGLVIVEPNTNGFGVLWLVDPETLHVKRCMRVPTGPMATSPVLSSLFIFARGPLVIDLASGNVVRGQFPRVTEAREDDEPAIEATADGRYLLAFAQQCILRMRIEKHDLVLEGLSEEIGAKQGTSMLSRDGNRVVVLCTPRKGAADGGPDDKPRVCVFDVRNLKKPLATFPCGAMAETVGDGSVRMQPLVPAKNRTQDDVAGNWYRTYVSHRGVGDKCTFEIHSSDDKVIADLSAGYGPVQMYPYPKGNAVLLQLAGELVWLRLPPPGGDFSKDDLNVPQPTASSDKPDAAKPAP